MASRSLDGQTHARWRDHYRAIRADSERIAAPLSPEDCTAQSMPDASPIKWHLAHTSWFFETFILIPGLAGYAEYDARYRLLFNSYYNGVGPQLPRAQRGLVTRPGLGEILDYRAHVDRAMDEWLDDGPAAADADLLALGLAHEQQHQELMLTDLKHLLFHHPALPAGQPAAPPAAWPAAAHGWLAHDGGLCLIGTDGPGFHFDNEGPRHRQWLEPFEIATQPVSNGQWLAFMADGGYRTADHWLADGWQQCRANDWTAPLYWFERDGRWYRFTLAGPVPVDPNAPVCHISYYEADAFAAWAGCRLPSEVEWEVAARADGRPHWFNSVWQWTRSAYGPYPGFRPADGAVGEYNGKFMSGQMVLRGGSAATPTGHVRPTYRNFFPPAARWQFSGLRLARDARPRRPAHAAPATADGALIAMRRAGAAATLDRSAVIAGLCGSPAVLPSALFYDPAGCRMFEAITECAEYYPTRTEAAILSAHGADIAAAIDRHLGGGWQMVDLGAGDCMKAERLLPLLRPSRYIAVDIAGDFLEAALQRIARADPACALIGIETDLGRGFRLPADLADRPTLFFYPGSSLGNFEPDVAVRFLSGLSAALDRSALLLGVDRVKPAAILEAAYDDGLGLTAAFNRNILRATNRLTGADFEPAQWRHVALFDAAAERVEMHLEARDSLLVRWPGGARPFTAGERIRTEISLKWTAASLDRMLAGARATLLSAWSDPQQWFTVALAGLPRGL